MATYAIGDLQGCLTPLEALLARVAFDPASDTLWFCGDLVNRGPDSLAILRFVRDLGESAITVLGNHDLHLLAVARGGHRKKNGDTLDAILAAPDCDELIDWLRHRPVMHREHGFALVHAGIAPAWTVAQAQEYAHELEAALQSADHGEFLHGMYGNKPASWSVDLRGMARLRYITNAFTRMRYCHLDGRLQFKDKCPPGQQADGSIPWFEVPGRRSVGSSIIFGHWATLQVNDEVAPRHRVIHVDTGCLWGGRLTAYRLEDGRFFDVPCG
ncbi:MAG: symmetrical bis(5'-nucleosyl)-tetraphosphatase [Gammaproteobacteria bacterium]|nr:symmetrical bis(5'-nucleosyl)-tetraphosphatase [Gammaproteobacteria bacterium]